MTHQCRNGVDAASAPNPTQSWIIAILLSLFESQSYYLEGLFRVQRLLKVFTEGVTLFMLQPYIS